MSKKIIRLTESDLHNIVKESVRNILIESEMDAKVKMVAQEALSKAGYEDLGDTYNPYIIKVKINDFKDVNTIKNLLVNVLGADPYYLNVEPKSNLLGTSLRAEIRLPGFTHTKFA